MSYRSVIWHEAGSYGAVGGFVPQRHLGTFTLPNRPEVGMILEVRGEDYQVVSAGIGYCHVRPMRMKAGLF